MCPPPGQFERLSLNYSLNFFYLSLLINTFVGQAIQIAFKYSEFILTNNDWKQTMTENVSFVECEASATRSAHLLLELKLKLELMHIHHQPTIQGTTFQISQNFGAEGNSSVFEMVFAHCLSAEPAQLPNLPSRLSAQFFPAFPLILFLFYKLYRFLTNAFDWSS